MKLTKRIMACLISVSMILSIMPVCTYAATYTPPTPIKGETAEDKAKRADLEYVFLGTSPAANDKSGKGGSYTGTLDELTKDFAWEEGGLVWIGIQVSNMTRLKDMFNSEIVDDNSISGLGSAALTIAYDSDYFTLPAAAQNAAAAQSGRLLNYPQCYDAVGGVHPNLYQFAGEGPYVWTEELSGGARESVEPLSLTKMTQTTPDSDNISTYKVKISLTSSRQDYDWLLFQNGANPTYGTDWDDASNNPMTDDPFLMAVIPLKMKGATPPAMGTKVIEGALSSALMNMSVGATTNGFAYYTSRDGGSGGVTNLHNYFNITSLVDLFPMIYDIEYYSDPECKNIIPGAGATGIANNTAITDVTITEPADDDYRKFISATDSSTGKDRYFTKWVYKDSANEEQDFDKLQTIGEAAAAPADITTTPFTPGSKIKVYPHYEDAVEVTYHYTPQHGASPAEQTATKSISPVDPTYVADAPTVGETGAGTFDFTVDSGYGIEGWYTTPNFQAGTKVTFGDKDTPNVTNFNAASNLVRTLYAKESQFITITFDKNYHDAADPKTKEVKITPNVQFSAPDEIPADWTRDGYTLSGWNTEANGSGTNYTTDELKALTTLSTSDTLYAMWTAATDPVTLNFDPNRTGVTANPASKSVKRGDKVYDNEIPTIADDGDYKFAGWYKGPEINAILADFVSGYPVDPKDADNTPLNTETVYGHWNYDETKADAVTVKFITDDETTPYAQVTVKDTESLGNKMPTDPEKLNAVFKEWNTVKTPTKDTPGSVLGKTTVVSTLVTGGSKELVVYAQFMDNVTITYNENNGTATPKTEQVANKKATDAYEDKDPATDFSMSKDGYEFVGWNTEKNGSGDYIKAGTGITYNDVAQKLGDDKTLYAQWRFVPTGTVPDSGGEVDSDPLENGVKITFDSNVTGNLTGETVEDAKPKYLQLKLGDKIGGDTGDKDLMPNDPKRTNYVFKGWYTQPDGEISGVKVDETTAFTTDLDGMYKPDAAVEKYEITLYARWDVDEVNVLQDQQVSITFNKNIDHKGDASTPANSVTYKLFKGDSLGFTPAELTSNKSTFEAWAKADAITTDGYIDNRAGEQFDETAAINDATQTYYAAWATYIIAILHDSDNADSNIANKANQFEYTGSEIHPKFDMYYAKENDADPSIYDKIETIGTSLDFSDANSQFSIVYDGDDTKEFKDLGTYSYDVAVRDGSDLAKDPTNEVASWEPNDLVITDANVKLLIDPDTQKRKANDANLADGVDISASITVNGAPTALDISQWTIKYYTWVDAEVAGVKDGEIQETELTEVTGGNPTAVGKYVVKVTPKSGYKISEVGSSNSDVTKVLQLCMHKDDTSVPADNKAPRYSEAFDVVTNQGTTSYEIKAAGSNIFYEIVPNDPSASAVEVSSLNHKNDPNNPVVNGPLGLKQSDYTNDQAFDNSENPTVKEYYVRVTDTDADQVQFKVTLTNEDTTTLTASNGATPEGAVVQQNADKTYTITAPLTNKGATPNVITITTKAGSELNAPTITYTFNIQQLVVAKVELSPGNSPYGLIERMKDKGWDDDKIQNAKDAFRDSNDRYKTYGTDLVPDYGNTNLRYTVTAWTSYTKKQTTESGEVDVPVNYDMDPTAVFVYQGTDFTLPETKAYDDLNNELQPTKITLKLMNQTKDDACSYVDTQNPTADNITNQVEEYPITPDVNGKYSLYNIRIRHDVYFADYEFEYTDVNGTTQTLKKSRPVIILGKLGDLFISELPVVNDDDMNELSANTTAIYYGNSLVAYRIADVVSMKSLTDAPVVNDDDMNELKANTTSIYYSTNQYYKNINELN